MKKILSVILLVTSVVFSSCIKEDLKTFEGNTFVEFDAAVLNTPATGKTYPILIRVPAYGTAVIGANPAITRTSGQIKFRVNLVGPQSGSDRTINYRVVTSESTAVQGTHFTTTGSLTIPANSSFGELTINVLNPGVSSPTPVVLVVELQGGGDIRPSENYKFLGISINQS